MNKNYMLNYTEMFLSGAFNSPQLKIVNVIAPALEEMNENLQKYDHNTHIYGICIKNVDTFI